MEKIRLEKGSWGSCSLSLPNQSEQGHKHNISEVKTTPWKTEQPQLPPASNSPTWKPAESGIYRDPAFPLLPKDGPPEVPLRRPPFSGSEAKGETPGAALGWRATSVGPLRLRLSSPASSLRIPGGVSR